MADQTLKSNVNSNRQLETKGIDMHLHICVSPSLQNAQYYINLFLSFFALGV